jgi:hypothetical protein
MISILLLRQAARAIKHLNPEEVLEQANCPLRVGILAGSNGAYQDIEEFLLPPDARPASSTATLERVQEDVPAEDFDLILVEQGLPCPAEAFTFFRDDPQRTIAEVLAEKPDLKLALARNFVWFRKPVVDMLVEQISRENALFSIGTALPHILPLLPVTWTIGEFASDMVFITMNQVRMAFLIAAANLHPIGYAEQKVEIAAVLSTAFGWRALARGLASKIPAGRGLIPKGAIAYAGTYVLGKGLQRYHEIGGGQTRLENEAAYQEGLLQGRRAVSGMLPQAG